MGRRQLFEFEDQTWYPDLLRRFTTEFLGTVLARTGRYAAAAEILAAHLDGNSSIHLLDLCSGDGQVAVDVAKRLTTQLGHDVRVTLSDKFPNLQALRSAAARHGPAEVAQTPVDAMRVPPHLSGFRTLFTAFHHFPPAAARSILRDAVEQGTPIAVFELADKGIGAILRLSLTIPLGVTLTTPFLRPRSWTRFLLTYVIPVVPVVIWWDGVVSVLRVYTPDELRMLTAGLATDEYQFEIGMTEGRTALVFLVGSPRTAAGSS